MKEFDEVDEVLMASREASKIYNQRDGVIT